jgi:hypothetical protein
VSPPRKAEFAAYYSTIGSRSQKPAHVFIKQKQTNKKEKSLVRKIPGTATREGMFHCLLIQETNGAV